MTECSLFYQLTEEDKVALMPQKLQSSDCDNTMIVGTADNTEPLDEEYEALLGSYYPQAEAGTLQQNISKPYFTRGCRVSTEQLEALTTEDNTVTAWETELRKCRMKRWAPLLEDLVDVSIIKQHSQQ
jgi:hypothetical protein